MKTQLVLLLLTIFTLVGLGFSIGRWSAPSPDVVYRNTITPPKATYDIPKTVFLYLPFPIEHTRVDTIRVPEYITDYVIANPDSAIQVKKDKVIFVYYNPFTQSYREDIYEIKPYHYSLSTIGGFMYMPVSQTNTVTISQVFRYKNWTFYGGAGTDLKRLYPYIGINYTLKQTQW
jgi:hypothetical protein